MAAAWPPAAGPGDSFTLFGGAAGGGLMMLAAGVTKIIFGRNVRA